MLHITEPFLFAMQAGARRTMEDLPSLMYRDFFFLKPLDDNCLKQTADSEDAHAAWSGVMSVLSGFVWDFD